MAKNMNKYRLTVTLEQNPGEAAGIHKTITIDLNGPTVISYEDFTAVASRCFDVAANAASEKLGSQIVQGCSFCKGTGTITGTHGTSGICPVCHGQG